MAPKKNELTLTMGEKVLCNASGMFYEAKVVEVKEEDGEESYLVHYQGWHKRYDEWIAQSEIPGKVKAFTAEALAEAKAKLKEAKASAKSGTTRKSGVRKDLDEGSGSRGTTPSETADGSKAPSTASEKPVKGKGEFGRGLKRKHDETGQEPTKDPYPRKSEISLVLPVELKHILVEDGDLINRQFKLYSLPCKYPVEQIINEYCEEMGMERSEMDKVLLEYDDGKVSVTQDAMQIIQSVKGLQDYFDSLLPFQLLYKMEKLQYSYLLEKHRRETDPSPASTKKRGRTVNTNKPPVSEGTTVKDLLSCKFYGFPHLLRLLTRFEYLVKQSFLNDRITDSIMLAIRNFSFWLNKNRDKYYHSQYDYEVSPPEYQRETFS